MERRYFPMFRSDQVIGQPPALAGEVCEGLLCQGVSADGDLLASANVVYLRFRGIWHRLCIDGGVIFWKEQDHEPAPWGVPDEGWQYPHVDVGFSTGIIGRRLDHYEMIAKESTVQVNFVFDQGRKVIIENTNDRSDYRIV